MVRAWAKKWFSLSSIKKLVKILMQIDDSPEKIARGFAIGIFWGIMPTLGLAVVFSFPTAIIFRANKFSSIIGTLISNPLTTPFFYTFSYKIGRLLLGCAPLVFSWELIDIEKLLNISKALLAGSIIFALSLSLLSYVLVLKIVAKYSHRAHAKANISEGNSRHRK